MNTVEEKRAAFHRYLEQCGVIEALGKALIKLYEEPNKPDDPIAFVRHYMGEENSSIMANEQRNENDEADAPVEENKESDSGVDTEQLFENSAEISGCESDEVLMIGLKDLQDDENCQSMVKQYLSTELIENLKDKKTENGQSLFDCIKCGLENHDHTLGLVAIDSQAYSIFADIFDLIIEGHHGFGKEMVQPECDWGISSTLECLDESDEFIVSIKFCGRRSIKGFPFIFGMSEANLMDLLEMIRTVTENFEEAMQGQFVELSEVSEELQTELSNYKLLFNNDNKFLASAGAYSVWPIGRAIFCNTDKTMVIWVNNEDHLKFMSTQRNGDFAACYQRLIDYVEQSQITYERHDRLGWLTISPSNVGTALQGIIAMKLTKLAQDSDKLNEIIGKYNVLGAHQEDGTYEIKTKQTLGIAEFEIAKSLYDCAVEIMNYEKEE